MKKLVIITDTWHPQVNGVVTALQNIVPILEHRDFEITIVHPGLFWTIPLFFYPEIRLSPLPNKKVYEILKNTNPDYIHIATEGPLGLSARNICIKNKWRFTTSYHTHFSQYAQLRIAPLFSTVTAYLKWFHNAGETTMVGSNGLLQELKDYGFKKLSLWPLGVDTKRFTRQSDTTSSPLSIPDFPKPVFVYFGRIAIEKNLEEFLHLNLPGTKLVIGEGPLQEELQHKYLDAVFTGYKHGQDLIDWLSVCDVMVFPSKTETFGLVILEALAMRIPVAAYNVTGPKDIITNGIDGYLSNDLQESAIQCLKINVNNCRSTALRYSWDKSTESFMHLLMSTTAPDEL